MKEKHKNIPASYLVLIRNQKILLLKRFNTGYEDGKYSLVAGHVDEGETFTQAIIREAYEEAGITLQSSKLKVVHTMHRRSIDSERVDVFFVADSWEGEIQNKEPHKCSELAWFELDKLPDSTIPYIRQAVDRIKEQICYSEYGWKGVPKE